MPDDECEHFSSQHSLVLLSVNVASWEVHANSVLAAGADIIAVQETRLNCLGQSQQDKAMATMDKPWHAAWGKPTGNPHNKYAKTARKASGKSAPEGVTLIARQHLPFLNTGRDSFEAKILHESTRWCSAAFPLGSSGGLSRWFLHVCSYYGIVTRRNDARHTHTKR